MVIGTVSVLRSWKGHALLLKAISLVESPIDFKCVIVGSGPQEGAIRDLLDRYELQDKVTLLGHHESVADILPTFDIFVFMSLRNEGIPQSLLQAMAAGLRIVSCDIPEAIETLNGYHNYTLFSSGNERSLRDVISKEILRPDVLSYRRVASIPYEWTDTFEKTMEVYKNADQRKYHHT